jgi:hypothetical protein
MNYSDGHIGIDKSNRGCWSFIGTRKLAETVGLILHFEGIKCRIIEENNFSTPMTRVVITRKDMIIKLRDYLYKNSVPSLKRKRDIFFNVKYKRRCNHG